VDDQAASNLLAGPALYDQIDVSARKEADWRFDEQPVGGRVEDRDG
jgi:hypothetical protein